MRMMDALLPARFSTDAAASDSAQVTWLQFAIIAIQLALVLLVLRQFAIEGAVFVQLAAFAFAGFAIHALLPLRWRLPFFAGLSLASLAFVLGPENAAWIVAVGAVLVGVCHLPLTIRARGCLLLGAAAVLMAQRLQWLPIPWPETIWPILGSMFMFRLIVYFYDLKNDKAPVTPAQSVGYFAMLPNACFPLFPVVDFKTFRRSHYATDAYATYQRGVDWIVRGIVHLILYRYIYYHLTLAPSEVLTPADLLQFLVTSFMIYLRVSGLFHLIVGLLHLFGFHLPETHNRYLLATSILDHWRRVNIYWKDFMQKVFYYPAVFAFKRLGTTKAILAATLYVFFFTWFLHSYQWFWLRGSWLFTPQDVLFWTMLGALVVLNSLYEIRFGRNRTIGKPAWNVRQAARNVAKAFGMFWLICLLWSFWSSESIEVWLAIWPALKGPYTAEVLLFPALALAIIVIGNIPRERVEGARSAQGRLPLLRRDRAITAMVLVGLLVVSIEAVHTRMGATVATTVHSLRSAQLSRLDAAKLERSYYDALMDVRQFNSQLWEVFSKRPNNWLAVDFDGLKRFTGGFAQYELIPSYVSASKYGTITMNRFGLRDKDYAEIRPPGTLRVALLGASSVMGWGVGDADTFEALLEKRLAVEPLATGFSAVELMNFGIPGYFPPQQLVNFDRALALQANAIFYIATGREQSRTAVYLAEVVRKRIAIPYPALQSLVEQSGVQPQMNEAEMLQRLQPLAGRLLQETYRLLGERARATGVTPVWIFLPQLVDGPWQSETPEARRLAEAAGFAVIDLSDVFRGQAKERIRLEEWDEHPNAVAHRLLADRLYTELARRVPRLFEGVPR
jgi:D-alanyl-lipoteichoic acid acyltransferase DltB (MBOAT superfamily)